jgi:hypothetical protein
VLAQYKGGFTLDKDFENFVATRCETALLESDDYLKLERGDCDPVGVQGLAETICYKKGFSDAVNLLKLR